MADYQLTQEAATDLAWIYHEGLDRFGEVQADFYLGEFYHLFDVLRDNPGMGVDFEVLSRKFQRHTHKSHVIIFEAIEDAVKIVRVLYGGSDYLQQL